MNAQDIIKAAEGLRLACYDDKTGAVLVAGATAEGTPTIGFGHTGPEVVPGLVWTQAQADAAFVVDLAHAVDGALLAVGRSVWVLLNDARKAALTDAAFTLGATKLRGFHHMLLAVCRQEWLDAHDQCLASKWGEEAPRRALRDANMLLSGNWPQEAAP